MANSNTEPQPKKLSAGLRRILLFGVPLAAAAVALVFYLLGGRYQSTDDAYVQAARAQISTDVAGRIVEIDVRDNEHVTRGQVLFRLQQRPFLIAVANAEAQLAGARLKVPALRATYRQRLADEAAAKANLAYRTRDYARQEELQKQGISSRAQLDQAKADFEAAQQQVAAAAQQVASALADLGGDPQAPVNSLPAVQQAQTTLDHAELELSYTSIYAPISGVVTKLEEIEVGDYVNAAVPLFALLSSTDIWVEANFKETQLTYIRLGQHVTFKVDAYPHHVFNGVVTSRSPGTGSSFSLLPPENSSGNWVKVVQRLPIRISIDSIDPGMPLAAGMSVEATVDTQHRRSLAFWR